MSEVLAGIRDASWYNTPGRATVYHVGATAVRRGHTVQRETAACDPDRVLLTLFRDADEVPLPLRCQRNGCKQRWPKEGESWL